MEPPAQDAIVVERRRSDAAESEQPRIKRARVSLACRRCRARKQKCDGAQDSCATCTRLGLKCQYEVPSPPKQDPKKLYITALEDRVAELESCLSGLGHDAAGSDHWREKQHQLRRTDPAQEETAHSDENVDLHNAAREPGSPGSNRTDSGASPSTLSRILGSVIKTQQKTPKSDQNDESNIVSRSVSVAELRQKIGPFFVSPSVANRLLDGWIKNLSTRYPVLHTPRLRELHARRDEQLDPWEEGVLHLVYANAASFETSGETSKYFAEQHYEAAQQNMDAVLELRDTRCVAYLLLMALYCLRVPRDPEAWCLAGLAVRLCIELGLHRKSTTNEVSMEKELRLRIFWSCYYLDREISVALARPPAISDNDMDAEFPLDVDEDVDDIGTLQQAAKHTADKPISPPSSLTPFIHFMRLRRIESKIEHVIYRVDRQTQTTPAIIQEFLGQLHSWQRAIPREYQDRVDTNNGPYNGIDVFMVFYYKCVRLLLYPQLSKPSVSLSYLKDCAEACAGVCESYKRLHRLNKADYSPLSLQSLFLAGLTLIYCTWLAPRNYLNVTPAISDCNVMLYVMAERWPPASKYRDVFERIKTNVIDVMAHGSHQANRAAGILDAEVAERCRTLDHGLPGAARTDYAQMISDMAKDRTRTAAGEGRGDDQRTSAGGRVHNTFLEHQHHAHSSPPKITAEDVLELVGGDGHGNFMDSTFMSNLEDWDIPHFGILGS